MYLRIKVEKTVWLNVTNHKLLLKTFLALPGAQIEAIVIVISERKNVIIEKQAALHDQILHTEEIPRGEVHLEIIKEEKMMRKKMALIQWTHRPIPMLHEVNFNIGLFL